MIIDDDCDDLHDVNNITKTYAKFQNDVDNLQLINHFFDEHHLSFNELYMFLQKHYENFEIVNMKTYNVVTMQHELLK